MERVKALRRLEEKDGVIIPGEMLRWDVWNGVSDAAG